MILGFRSVGMLLIVTVFFAWLLVPSPGACEDLAMIHTARAGGEIASSRPSGTVTPQATSSTHETRVATDGVNTTGEHSPAGTSGSEHESKIEEEEKGVTGILAHHLVDSNSYTLPWGEVELPLIPGDFSFLGLQYAHGFQITKHMIGLLVAALLVILLVIPGMSRTRKGEVPHGFGNFLEVLVVFIRDEVVYPNMGEQTGRKWLPFFLTTFFLILFSNLMGMIPYGTSATGNVNVTGGLALMMLVSLFYAGFREHGIKFIGTLIPEGVPVFVIPLLFPIEIFGIFVKHFALCIRLFANMLGGHTVIGVFLALIISPFVAFASVPGAVAIGLLELFVAFLQSYIFVMLASIFIGGAIHGH